MDRIHPRSAAAASLFYPAAYIDARHSTFTRSGCDNITNINSVSEVKELISTLKPELRTAVHGRNTREYPRRDQQLEVARRLPHTQCTLDKRESRVRKINYRIQLRWSIVDLAPTSLSSREISRWVILPLFGVHLHMISPDMIISVPQYWWRCWKAGWWILGGQI